MVSFGRLLGVGLDGFFDGGLSCLHSAAGHPGAFIDSVMQGARIVTDRLAQLRSCTEKSHACISGLVAEYIVAIDVTRVRFLADAFNLHDILRSIHF